MGTAWTYQGRLIDANSAADGLYDFQFKLFDANTDGNQLSSGVNKRDVHVIDGSFTLELDFSSKPNTFNGDARWLEIGVRPGELNDPNIYTVLSPRQKVTPTPYALYALKAFNVVDFDAVAGGTRDATAYIQEALDKTAAKGGGTVVLPAGQYLVEGNINVPIGVTLKGVLESPQYVRELVGTVILATGGENNVSAPPLFHLGDSSAVCGLSVYYPNQVIGDIKPYPWTFQIEGGDSTIENITLYNSYKGINVGPGHNERHRIRWIYGTVIKCGIHVEYCTDIGRIENIEFHPQWWGFISGATMETYKQAQLAMIENCTAFEFGWTDWEYVTNTFVWCANIGYHFIHTDPHGGNRGEANGQFCGIGCDKVQTGILVEHIQPMGLLITNGEFVANANDGSNTCGIYIDPNCTGNIRLVNCGLWGSQERNVVSYSQSFLSLSDCYFRNSFSGTLEPPAPLITAYDGRLQIKNCSFESTSQRPHISIKSGVEHAIITGNNGRYTDSGEGGVNILNEIGIKAIIKNNEPLIHPVP